MPGSFRNYGKIDPYLQFQHETRRKERRRIVTIAAASAFLFVAVVCVIVVVAVRRHSSPSSAAGGSSPQFSSGSAAIMAACNHTRFPETCLESFSDNPDSLSANPLQLVTLGVKIAMSKGQEALNLSQQLAEQTGMDPRELMALQDCSELLGNVLDYLNESVAALLSLNVGSLKTSLQSIEILLSTASSEQTACSDGFFNVTGSAKTSMLAKEEDVYENLINSVGLVEALSELGTDLSSWKSDLPTLPKFHLRRLLSEEDDATGVRNWVSLMERELATAAAPSSGGEYDMVVAQDGSGDYKTLKAALHAVPDDYSGRYVIYIKAGTYNEGPLNISKSLKNLTLQGDGCNQTIITGDANVALKGYTTYRSATLGIAAKGFFARNITFSNTAGPAGHQAVAVRANAESVVFEGCCFEGYQDTLYALSGKQLYTGCKIKGTVDFIFGNSLAVFQSCELQVDLPAEGQENTYTAQGRGDSALVTGFAFQNCTLTETDALKNASYAVSTYLGRPWKAYSTSVFLQSYYGPHISPAGWLDWNASDPFHSTCFYGEYLNTGPGSGISGRVSWPGVHPALTKTQALEFTVQSFFPDASFIPAGTPYQASL